jgi:uncharacterized membrane protein YvlD (DUF360 family)
MLSLLVSWLAASFALGLAAYLLRGVKVKGGLKSYLIVPPILGLLTAFFGWIAAGWLAPFTLGLSLLFSGVVKIFVGAVLLRVANLFTERLEVESLGTAVVASVIMAITSSVAAQVFEAMVRGSMA